MTFQWHWGWYGDVYREWQCQGCNKWFRYEALDVDHDPPITDIWEDVEPANWVEGQQAYNDVNNLRLLCSTCNRCHCWEPESDSDSDVDMK